MEYIIIILILQWGLSLITKSKSNLLYCGLIGFVPNKSNNKANLDWIKLILSYNTLRGTDSCGIFMNHLVRWGVDSSKDVRVWLSKNELKYDDAATNRAIIGHTRKSTYGVHNVKNAHPFLLQNNKKGNKHEQLILAHNGTINNIWELCNERKINHDNIKVDSEALAKIIFETGSYEVLEHYKGAAALLMQNPYEPNTIIIFKGSSQGREDKLVEERPLFYLTTSHGIYISSLKEALLACAGLKADIKTFPANQVIQIKNNKFKILTEINRDKAYSFNKINQPTTNLMVPYQRKGMNQALNAHIQNYEDEYYDSKNYKQQWNVSLDKRDTQKKLPLGNVYDSYCAAFLDSSMDVYEEESYLHSSTSFVYHNIYYLAGRYCTNTIVNSGIKSMCANYPNFDSYLLNGFYNISDNKGVSVINLVEPDISTNTNVSTYFLFYEGVLIMGKKREKFIRQRMHLNLDNETNMFKKIQLLSSFSTYPITYLHSITKALKSSNLMFFENGHKTKTIKTIIPLFQRRRYTHSNGQLSKVESEKVGDNIFNENIPIRKDITANPGNSKVKPIDSIIKPTGNSKEVEELLVFRSNVLGEFDILRTATTLEEAREIIEIEKDSGISPTHKYTVTYKNEPIAVIDGEEILETALQQLVSDLAEDTDNPEGSEQLIEQQLLEMQNLIEEIKTFHNLDLVTFIDEIIDEYLLEVTPEFEESDTDEQKKSNTNTFTTEIGNETF